MFNFTLKDEKSQIKAVFSDRSAAHTGEILSNWKKA